MSLSQLLGPPVGFRGKHRAPKLVVTALPVQAQPLIDAMQSSHPGVVVGFSASTAVFAAGMPVLLSGLTPQGVACSWLLGGSIFSAFGAGGFALVCAYFILGSAATKFKLSEKQAKGIAEKRSGRRGPVRHMGSLPRLTSSSHVAPRNEDAFNLTCMICQRISHVAFVIWISMLT